LSPNSETESYNLLQDILGDLLSRFGGLLIVFHPNILEALSPQLKSPRLAVRKRSVGIDQV
jgi:hypothetical protein